MYYGKWFVEKLLEAKHLGQATITDGGTPYKLCRREPLLALLPALRPEVNLEFNAYFLDMVLERGLHVVECLITFHPRMGVSTDGNTKKLAGLGRRPAHDPRGRLGLVDVRSRVCAR